MFSTTTATICANAENLKLKTDKQKLTRKLLKWFGQNARDLPWRRTRDPYAIWISEIMLQQTQVRTVIAYWERWMRELPDVRAFARADSPQVHKLWEGLGYYARARNAHLAAQMIGEKFGGAFPRTFGEVLALPGIGRYTAGAICSIAYDLPVPILDGNVMRVLTRVFGISGNPREKSANARLWELAQELVSLAGSGNAGRLNESLMELGALVCVPRQPRCNVCPLRRDCVALAENRVAELPMLKVSAPATQRRFAAFIVNKNGRYLARQRPAGVVNAYLWEFPNVEIAAREKDVTTGSPYFLGAKKPFCLVRHTITRYRISLEAYQARLRGGRAPGAWRTLAQLDKLAFTSAHRKILTALKIQAG